MSFWLLTEAWLPAHRASGRTPTIRPCDIPDRIDSDPIVALDLPRPNFRLADLEFLIGLLATACPPADDYDGWLTWWATPATPEILQAAFARFTHVFLLDGDGPRYVQDFEDFRGEANRVETLLIDAQGGQTRKKNADHFVRRDVVTTMNRAAAALAPFTLQSLPPPGTRVGLRGGGPLTTLATPWCMCGRTSRTAVGAMKTQNVAKRYTGCESPPNRLSSIPTMDRLILLRMREADSNTVC